MANLLGRVSRLGSFAAKNVQVNTSVPSRTYYHKDLNLNLPLAVRRVMYNLSGFNQYGLYRDDLLVEYPDVTEALRRLPKEELVGLFFKYLLDFN